MVAYSNPTKTKQTLEKVLSRANSEQRAELEDGPRPVLELRQVQKRLREPEVKDLVAAYREGARVKELATTFGVHRTTVTAVLRRCGVRLRPVGLGIDQLEEAYRLYAEGWSVARLGEYFGVDGTTVWRGLLARGVAMRSPNDPRSGIRA